MTPGEPVPAARGGASAGGVRSMGGRRRTTVHAKGGIRHAWGLWLAAALAAGLHRRRAGTGPDPTTLVSNTAELVAFGGTVKAAVLALAAALALAAPAQAQTVATLASNLEETSSPGDAGRLTANSFVAGADPRGYVITAMRLVVNRVPANGVASVVLRENGSNDRPGRLVAAFTHLDSLAVGVNTFTAPPGTVVRAGRTYWVSLNEGVSQAHRAGFGALQSSDQTGWDIGDRFFDRREETSSWVRDFDVALSMSIHGHVRTNSAPVVANGIPDRAAVPGEAFSYAFPENAFADADVDGDTLSYAATRGDDSALPAWLSFDPATRTFSGTPGTADLGTLTVKVTASDDFGGAVSDTFDIVVSTNRAPVVANGIPDRETRVGQAFSYAFPEDTFSDPDGDGLAYAATQDDGSALPSWLTFTVGTRTFSGTPAAGDTGTVTVRVTASDGNGGSASDAFDIVVGEANNAPVVANGIPDQAARSGSRLSHTFPEDTFADADGDPLAYTATQDDGSALPSWLTFTAATRTFAGTPALADVRTLTVKVTASDGTDSVSDTFDIVVRAGNAAPTVATAIPDQAAPVGTAFSYVFPATTFADADGDTLTYTATRDSSALPDWLTFDPATRTFAGTPAAANAGTVTVRVTASDGNGGSVSDDFRIAVAAGICARTAQVRTAILARLDDVSDCANVTAAHLAGIGSLALANSGITGLQAHDFDGLTALTALELDGNRLGALPAGVFDGLTALTSLRLSQAGLGALPAGAFAGLTALTSLRLNDNGFVNLPDGAFDGLTRLGRFFWPTMTSPPCRPGRSTG